jgi:hypothetical protein
MNGFRSNDILPFTQKIGQALFSYFLMNYPQIKNVVILTFFFCELALMDLHTGKFLSKLLSKSNSLLNTIAYTDEDTFFSNLLKYFRTEINVNFIAISDMLITIEKIIKKLIHDHNFFLSILDILNLCKNGLEYKKRYPTTFQRILDGRWIDYMAETFLSPLIIQPEGKFSILNRGHDFVDRLTVLFGVTIMLEYTIHNKKIYCCPFHDNIPICKLHDKYNISEICLSDPFSVTPFEDGGCLFYNSCLILGLLPSSEFNRLIENEKKEKEV